MSTHCTNSITHKQTVQKTRFLSLSNSQPALDQSFATRVKAYFAQFIVLF